MRFLSKQKRKGRAADTFARQTRRGAWRWRFVRQLSLATVTVAGIAAVASTACAAELHVATNGSDANPGTRKAPFRTIQHAADLAQPGDVITVHTGIYREWVKPPRGGTNDAHRITYQAAPGEKITITGSDCFKTWKKISGDTWKLVIPNSYFGGFNPYVARVYGGWFDAKGRVHRRGNVYLNGDWITEAASLDAVMIAGDKPAWFSVVDGLVEKEAPAQLVRLASIKVGDGKPVPAYKPSSANNWKCLPKSKDYIMFLASDCWVSYDNVDFGRDSDTIELSASAIPDGGGTIELREGMFDGPLLGTCEISPTGDWKQWRTFTARIKKTSGVKQLSLVIKSGADAVNNARNNVQGGNTTIYARFPDVKDPNNGEVEVCVRPTVFTPEKTNINYITLRGFDLRNAASNWASPSAGQQGLVTAYWNKGWLIENNEISYSRCCGIALGKYSDEWDGQRDSTEGYYKTVEDAYRSASWNKATIGSHLVRNNHIHHCGQAGIVGSLGAAFSIIEGNDIHDINTQDIWAGAEMAGIKIHAAVDVVVRDNHIHHCGKWGGLWFDWMAQGTIVTGNLFHDNWQDLMTEVDHGPFLVANNLFLSPRMQSCAWAGSQGGAFAHNLISGSICNFHSDARRTHFFKPHSTEVVGLRDNPVGDVRWYNNLFANDAKFTAYDKATLPVAADGNVFISGASASKFDKDALVKSDFDARIKLVKKDDGWYLMLAEDPAWRNEVKRQLVTTALLGRAVIPDQEFTKPDGSSLKLDADYFGKPRNKKNPFPGPFENATSGNQEIKVWPVGAR